MNKDFGDINKMFIDHSKDLYSSKQGKSFSFDKVQCNQIQIKDLEDLAKLVSNQEIYNTLKRICQEKVPDIDGINAHFFTTY